MPTEMHFSAQVRRHGDWTIVDASGEVDLYTAPQLKERLAEESSADRSRIAVNLEGVEFLDSTGLGVLIGALKRCREAGGDLVLVAPREPIRKILSITGLENVFRVHDTIEQATG